MLASGFAFHSNRGVGGSQFAQPVENRRADRFSMIFLQVVEAGAELDNLAVLQSAGKALRERP